MSLDKPKKVAVQMEERYYDLQLQLRSGQITRVLVKKHRARYRSDVDT